ncbi:chemotaxis protein histidine kinase-like protein [Beggiatoa alba B18LD]|uniref:Chemotaxis protein CheA n=1 Tax=Beggiatoa alba B18LD TaxID=395493 RepID=I3CFN9_9GAMM|nr:chemotaxis protein CheA [Beggiatoa alba]EIJ42432.1 chemotaxis protein histidine kinase-like protein [Beggiatoa alba B18LD]
MAIDMTEVRQLFFEESFESLDTMEANLLDLDIGIVDTELINSIFRVAHSIKGGAGIFKFEQVVQFAHTAETLLDSLRTNQRWVTQETIDVLLQAVDILRMMLTRLKENISYNETDLQAIQEAQLSLETMLKVPQPIIVPTLSNIEATIVEAENTAPPASSLLTTSVVAPIVTENKTSPQIKGWRIVFKPHSDLLKTGNDPVNLFRELATLGRIEIQVNTEQLPPFVNLDPKQCYLSWTLTLYGDIPRTAIDEIFEWVEGDCYLEITALDALSSATTSSASDRGQSSDESSITTNDIEAVSVVQKTEPVIKLIDELEAVSSNLNQLPQADTNTSQAINLPNLDPEELEEFPIEKKKNRDNTRNASGNDNSIRVSIDKIDALINMVGELVITQSMLDQIGENFDPSKLTQLRDGLTQLERNTRELQESVMRIRMLPISYSFNRFPRLVHDLSVQLNKKVELKLSGENTELDKTVLEKMNDPLVHLVRNALDHGIESPAQRLELGKPETGILHLHAYHQSGNIIIQISDDGAGFDLKKIHQKAIKLGLIDPKETPTAEELYEFIFHPGLSTSDQINDVSGRGVGMDVVRRNIRMLGGSIDIRSEQNKGTIFTIRLPLTLAILDGQLVKVGQEIYILSLLSIIESLHINKKLVSSLAGQAEVYKLRDDYIPIVRLYSLFNIQTDITDLDKGLLVIVEGEGQKIGLFVDELLSQQQIVIKSLESNYKQVEGVSGATILGNGSVALIIDIAGLIRLFHQQTAFPRIRPRITQELMT